MRSRRSWLVLAATLLVVAGWPIYHYREWFTGDRTLNVATPSPFFVAAETDILLEPGQRVCISPVALTPRGSVARISAERSGRAPAPLRFEARGPGYSSSAVIRTWESDTFFDIPFDPPREEVLGQACVTNLGRESVAMSASKERTATLQAASAVDGREVEGDVGLAFVEREPRSLAAALPDLLDRIAVWKPGGGALLWPLAVLVLAGIPLGITWAFAWSAARD